ncbi:hypothetical protein KIL84_003495 [Mauremys mutica]|uniref:Uncharacterized protein n=1 Tax=Mauremys mutica TaxID=74926 RepID=A0A9D4AMR3_9SAUR|nr:hypothetical protein KIL84_003495 [Mauremys mutica]
MDPYQALRDHRPITPRGDVAVDNGVGREKGESAKKPYIKIRPFITNSQVNLVGHLSTDQAGRYIDTSIAQSPYVTHNKCKANSSLDTSAINLLEKILQSHFTGDTTSPSDKRGGKGHLRGFI